MEVVAILRQLWRRRGLVFVGVGLALATAVLTAYRVDPGGSPVVESRQYDVGVASASVLVDSQSSQVVDLGRGEEEDPDLATLAARAQLLATLMASSPLKDQIGARAGLPADSLIASVAEPVVAATPVTTGTTVSPSDPEASILTLQTSESIPIIRINAQGSSEAVAAGLASAAAEEVVRYMKSVAAGNSVPDARQLIVTPLGPASSDTVVKNARRWFAVAAFFVVLVTWCAGIVLLPALRRHWREAARVEAAGAGTAGGGQELEAPEDDQDAVVGISSAPPPAASGRLSSIESPEFERNRSVVETRASFLP